MMRTWGLVLVLAALALTQMGCANPTGTARDDPNSSLLVGSSEVVLRYGDEKAVKSSVLRVAFGEVLSDSRCPVDVVCVWEGNAEVEIGIRAGMGPTIPLHLNTSLDPRFVDWQEIRITLLELSPAPRSDATIKPEDYSVRLKLESLR